MAGAVLIITITDRSRGGEFAAWFQGQGASLVLSALGRGTAATEVLDCLGLEATEKAVLMLAAPRSSRLVRKAERELWLDVPGRGILMAVPISSIGGARARDYLLQGQAEEDAMEKEITHELIVVITNRGCTDQVMDAARAAGAAGGTTIHAKGTGEEVLRRVPGGGKGDGVHPHPGGGPQAHHEGGHGPGGHADQGPVRGVFHARDGSGGPAEAGGGRGALRNRPRGKSPRGGNRGRPARRKERNPNRVPLLFNPGERGVPRRVTAALQSG